MARALSEKHGYPELGERANSDVRIVGMSETEFRGLLPGSRLGSGLHLSSRPMLSLTAFLSRCLAQIPFGRLDADVPEQEPESVRVLPRLGDTSARMCGEGHVAQR